MAGATPDLRLRDARLIEAATKQTAGDLAQGNTHASFLSDPTLVRAQVFQQPNIGDDTDARGTRGLRLVSGFHVHPPTIAAPSCVSAGT
jgi:hypothetical protein